MDDKELYDDIMWVMKFYGSKAGDAAEPGSRLKAQAERICEFVRQREEANMLLANNKLDLVKVVRR